MSPFELGARKKVYRYSFCITVLSGIDDGYHISHKNITGYRSNIAVSGRASDNAPSHAIIPQIVFMNSAHGSGKNRKIPPSAAECGSAGKRNSFAYFSWTRPVDC